MYIQQNCRDFCPEISPLPSFFSPPPFFLSLSALTHGGDSPQIEKYAKESVGYTSFLGPKDGGVYLDLFLFLPTAKPTGHRTVRVIVVVVCVVGGRSTLRS